MKCPYCEGRAARARRDYEFERDGHVFTFKNVPVIVCSDCGEVLIEGQTFAELTASADKLERSASPRARRRA